MKDGSTSSLVYPVNGRITPGVGEYGAPRKHGKPHAGVDFFVGIGTPVKAVTDGVVESAFEIKQGSSKQVTYGHVMVSITARTFIQASTRTPSMRISAGWDLRPVRRSNGDRKSQNPAIPEVSAHTSTSRR